MQTANQFRDGVMRVSSYAASLALLLTLSGSVRADRTPSISGPDYPGDASTGQGTALASTSGWTQLGLGLHSFVYALALTSNGDLYAGGYFDYAYNPTGSVLVNRIARWNGVEWSALGQGTSAYVYALAVDASDNVYVGGNFPSAGGGPANNIARWSNGWYSVGSGLNDTVFALAADRRLVSDGIFAGGVFTTAITSPTLNYVGRWDSSAWNALELGTDGLVRAMAMDDDGNLYAGGGFHFAGGPVNHVARWKRYQGWSALGSGLDDNVFAMTVDSSGNAYAGGQFTNHVAMWNGSSWQTVGGGVNGNVYSLAVDDCGILYVGGDFTSAGTISATNIALWNGSSWAPLGSGTDDGVYAIAPDGCMSVYVGGWFTQAGGTHVDYIAHWSADKSYLPLILRTP